MKTLRGVADLIVLAKSVVDAVFSNEAHQALYLRWYGMQIAWSVRRQKEGTWSDGFHCSDTCMYILDIPVLRPWR